MTSCCSGDPRPVIESAVGDVNINIRCCLTTKTSDDTDGTKTMKRRAKRTKLCCCCYSIKGAIFKSKACDENTNAI